MIGVLLSNRSGLVFVVNLQYRDAAGVRFGPSVRGLIHLFETLGFCLSVCSAPAAETRLCVGPYVSAVCVDS